MSQAKKSIRNLHAEAVKQIGLTKILEVSTRSEEVLGISLSAFNLPFEDKSFSVESAYQSSKVFENISNLPKDGNSKIKNILSFILKLFCTN